MTRPVVYLVLSAEEKGSMSSQDHDPLNCRSGKVGTMRKEDLCKGSPRAYRDGLKPQPGVTLQPSDGVTVRGLSHLVEIRTPKWAT